MTHTYVRPTKYTILPHSWCICFCLRFNTKHRNFYFRLTAALTVVAFFQPFFDVNILLPLVYFFRLSAHSSVCLSVICSSLTHTSVCRNAIVLWMASIKPFPQLSPYIWIFINFQKKSQQAKYRDGRQISGKWFTEGERYQFGKVPFAKKYSVSRFER